MEIPPGLKKFLESVGVNTTRLQWRLEEFERRRRRDRLRSSEEDDRRDGSDADRRRWRLPAALRWLEYRHKFCEKCGALADRDERICPRCDAPLPRAAVYKLTRAIGLVSPPTGSVVVSFCFLTVIIALFAISVADRGPGAIMNPDSRTLHIYGAQAPYWLRQGQWWRMLGFGLFHAGLIHLLFNSMALVQAGPMIETELGTRRTLVLITLCQIGAAAAVQIVGQGAVGASGWLCGLIGFGITWYHRRGGAAREMRNRMIQWAVYVYLFGLMIGNVSHAGHTGGLVAGAILGLTADVTPARRTRWTRVWEGLFVPSILLWGATALFLARSILSQRMDFLR